MTDEEYELAQRHIMLLLPVLRGIDTGKFLSALRLSESMAPILDPTLAREAIRSGKVEVLKRVAEALHQARKEIYKAELEHVSRHSPEVVEKLKSSWGIRETASEEEIEQHAEQIAHEVLKHTIVQDLREKFSSEIESGDAEILTQEGSDEIKVLVKKNTPAEFITLKFSQDGMPDA